MSALAESPTATLPGYHLAVARVPAAEGDTSGTSEDEEEPQQNHKIPAPHTKEKEERDDSDGRENREDIDEREGEGGHSGGENGQPGPNSEEDDGEPLLSKSEEIDGSQHQAGADNHNSTSEDENGEVADRDLNGGEENRRESVNEDDVREYASEPEVERSAPSPSSRPLPLSEESPEALNDDRQDVDDERQDVEDVVIVFRDSDVPKELPRGVMIPSLIKAAAEETAYREARLAAAEAAAEEAEASEEEVELEDLPPPTAEPTPPAAGLQPVPYMKGALEVDPDTGDHVYLGEWGMGKVAFLPGGSTSRFEFRCPGGDGEVPRSGDYRAFFEYKLPPQQGGGVEKVDEKELHLTFTRNSAGGWNVLGRGSNKFGNFTVTGTMGPDRKLLLFRLYAHLLGGSTPRKAGQKRGGGAWGGKRRAPHTPVTQQTSAIFPEVKPEIVRAASQPVGRMSQPVGRPAHKRSSSSLGHMEVPIAATATNGLKVTVPSSHHDGGTVQRRKIKAPNHHLEDEPRNSVRLTEGLKKCIPLLKQLSTVKDKSFWFMTPVDPHRDKLPNYFNVIKKPMDLGTVRSKLERGEYNDIYEFASDVRQIFINAVTFSTNPKLPVHIAAKELSNMFEHRFQALEAQEDGDYSSTRPTLKRKKSLQGADRLSGGPRSVGRGYGGGYGFGGNTPGGSSAGMGGKRKSTGNVGGAGGGKRGRPSSAGASSDFGLNMSGGVPASQLAEMQRKVDEMQATILQLQRQASIGDPRGGGGMQPVEPVYEPEPEPEPPEDDEGPMSFDEKRQLSININNLPPDKLHRVVQIIQERMPLGTQQDETEIEIDLDSMDTSTLRELQAYVETCMQRSGSSKARARQRTPANSDSDSDGEWS